MAPLTTGCVEILLFNNTTAQEKVQKELELNTEQLFISLRQGKNLGKKIEMQGGNKVSLGCLVIYLQKCSQHWHTEEIVLHFMAGVYQKENILCSNVPKTPIEQKFQMVILCVCVFVCVCERERERERERENMSEHECSSNCTEIFLAFCSTEN